MFWDRFSSLCTESGKSPNAVAKELGIPSGSITAWKNGSAPRNITLVKIASYFDVSTDYLSSREQEKSPAPLGAELDLNRIQSMLPDMSTEDLAAIVSMAANEMAKRSGK